MDNIIRLLTSTGVGTGNVFRFRSVGPKVVRAKLTGTGAVSATINIYGSTEESTSNGVLLGTLSPSGTDSAVDSFNMDAPWPYIWADQTAISGTGAATTVDVGY